MIVGEDDSGIGQPDHDDFGPIRPEATATCSGTSRAGDAEVSYLSADRLVDDATEQSFYTARLRITGALPEEVPSEQVYPGMPVEVFISTAERTFFEYLAQPITDSFNRAFREE